MSISVPAINANFKIEVDNTSVSLNKLNQEYNEVYSYNGFGKLFSASFKLSSSNTCFKTIVDDNTVCEIDVSVLSEVTSFGNELTPIPLIYDANRKVLYLKFNNALQYNSNVTFCFQKNNNSNKSESMDGYQICLTKEGN